MKNVILFLLVTLISFHGFSQGTRQLPARTYPACGIESGYYRPQRISLSAEFPPRRVQTTTYYAPSGRNQRNWNQYYPKTNTYGPTEPNPFNANGTRSNLRSIRHLIHTRLMN